MTPEEGEKQLSLIDELYKSLWADSREWRRDIVSFVIAALGVGASLKWGLEKPDMLFKVCFGNEVFLIWILFIVQEAGYKYREHQAISTSIERIFKSYQYKGQTILPEDFLKPETNLPEFYKIHAIFFGVSLVLHPFLYLFSNCDAQRSAILFFVMLVSLLMVISYGEMRWKKLRKRFPDRKLVLKEKEE